MGILKLPSGNYRLQIRRRGVTVDRVFTTKDEAEEEEKKYRKPPPTPTAPPAAGPAPLPDDKRTVQKAWEDYENSLDYLEKQPRTRDTEAGRIKRILRRFGDHPVDELTSRHVEDYIKQRKKDEPTPSATAIRLEVAALSALLNYCRDQSWIASNPCLGVRRPQSKIELRRLSTKDQGALMSLLSHENYRFRAVARLCLLVRETGARPGEWQKARASDIDLDEAKVVFRNTKYRGELRTVPLTKAAMALLAEQLDDVQINQLEEFGETDLVFPALSKNGLNLRPMHYTGALRDAKKKALLPKSVRGHIGRHEFISSLLEETDMSDARIMALVGHHSPASMEIYKHVRNVRFRPAIEEIEPQRREQRIRALATDKKIPRQVIEALLARLRKEAKEGGLEDSGEELLYTSSIQKMVESRATRLGKRPEDRIAHARLIAQVLTALKVANARDAAEIAAGVANEEWQEATGRTIDGESSEVLASDQPAPAKLQERSAKAAPKGANRRRRRPI